MVEIGLAVLIFFIPTYYLHVILQHRVLPGQKGAGLVWCMVGVTLSYFFPLSLSFHHRQTLFKFGVGLSRSDISDIGLILAKR